MKLKAIIADDMVLFRRLLSDAMSSLPDVEVAGVAANGAIALRLLEEKKADVVFMDVYMPEMDGLEALKRIRISNPATQVIMVSGVADREADVVIGALRMGALDFIRKPAGPNATANLMTLRKDVERALDVVRARLAPGYKPRARLSTTAQAPGKATAAAPVAARPKVEPGQFSLLAIGSSTGGPEALAKIIPLLPAGFPLPVVIVQHMPPVFTAVLAENLARQSRIRVREAADGDRLESGLALIAPGGRHMTVKKNGGGYLVELNDGQPENSCRPSVDVLFRSLAETFADKWVLSLVLTGMGQDGMKGVEILRKKNKCLSLVQSRETCVIYGMPRAVEENGLADRAVHLDEIARELAALASKNNSI
ncbi:MAG: chemotaxis-specific protein-glutamate methyltransferase CheB [Nitrospinae bacterium]|nr:chemotaxis-specific protein-glutamate methyltransferase CheB [Nitrospinota bacterium]